MVNSCTLVIFTRYPELGKTKTRMMPALGAEGALQLHQELTQHTLATAKKVQSQLNHCAVQIHFHGGDRDQMGHWLGKDLTFEPQSDGDLGAKMHHSFQSTLHHNLDRTIIIGTDCPSLTVAGLMDAFKQLQTHDVILGPAWDGGYYLIGLNQPQPQLFEGISWGTEQVWKQTLAIVEQLALKLAVLKQLPDIDRPEDLVIWEQIKSA